MSTEADFSAEYRPFPRFSEWQEFNVSLRDVEQSTIRFEQVKATVSATALENALESARREAAMDTNAIEGVFHTDRGFTRTVAFRLGAWEQEMNNRGQHIRPAFEDTLAGFEHVMDAMTRAVPVSEHWIRELHALMLRSQETHEVYTAVGPQRQDLLKGEYKKQPNSPTRSDDTVYAYASVDATPSEMNRLITELRSEEFASVPPVLQAAYAHYAFVCIHPFSDGNGRVARALASIYLYRSPGVPLVIYQDQRADYIGVLEAADNGDPRPLIRFIAERVTDTMNLILTDLSRPKGPQSGSDKLAKLLAPTRAKPELHDAAVRLQELVHSELTSRLAVETSKHGLKFALHRSLIGTPGSGLIGYSAFGDDLGITLSCSANSPKKIFVILNIVLLARDGDTATSDLTALTDDGYRLDVFAREVQPVVTESSRGRVRIYADGVMDTFLGRVATAFQK